MCLPCAKALASDRGSSSVPHNPMKVKSFLVCSLVLNACLLILALRQPRISGPPDFSRHTDGASNKPKTLVRTITETRETSLPDEIIPLEWRTVESPDFKEYIARLRAVACPEETIRDIIIADVNKLYAAKWRAMLTPPATVRYWEPWDVNEQFNNPDMAAKRRDLDAERRELIKDLLGVDVEEERRKSELRWTWLDREDALMEFLPPGKREKIQALRKESRDTVQAITDRAKGNLTPVDREAIAQARAKEQSEMRATLTPEEFDQYVLRVSATANSVRSSLLGFDPSREEFEAVFWAQTELNNKFKSYTGDPRDPEHLKVRAEAQKAMEERIRATLGEQRYAEYQKTRNPDFRDLYRFAQQMGLSKDVAKQAYEIKTMTEQHVMQLQANASLTPEQRQAAHQAIVKETRTMLGELMGAEAFQNYERGRGHWLRNMGR